ncbi:MAG: hypothetical protein C4326_07920 [Ignavibacteria bacterium]
MGEFRHAGKRPAHHVGGGERPVLVRQPDAGDGARPQRPREAVIRRCLRFGSSVIAEIVVKQTIRPLRPGEKSQIPVGKPKQPESVRPAASPAGVDRFHARPKRPGVVVGRISFAASGNPAQRVFHHTGVVGQTGQVPETNAETS